VKCDFTHITFSVFHFTQHSSNKVTALILKHFVANVRYLKYFVEIILKLKFLIYQTYSDRYRRPLVSGRSLEMTESILWSVRILCWSLALPRILRVNAVPFVGLRNELGNLFGGFWQRFWLLARVCCIARPLLWMWNSTARSPLKLSSLGSKFLQGSAGGFDNTFAVLVCSGTAFSSGCPCC
jgi:hypothetical protein